MQDSPDHDPSRIFAELKDRPTPELDSGAAWSRLRAQLSGTRELDAVAHNRAHLFRWAGLAAVAATVAVVALLLRTGPTDVAPAREMVLLAEPPAQPGTEMDPSRQSRHYSLEFRLVRGYTGEPPTAALDETTLGAGGASLRADLEPTLRALDPDREHAVIGAWAGDAEIAAAGVGLSAEFALHFGLEPVADGVRLRNVELLGVEPPLVADQMSLSPGRLYVFGVRGTDSGTTDLVLAVRLRAQPGSDPEPPHEN